jgi:hypothetical protein
LLPATTLAMVRVKDTPLLVSRFRETGVGRIFQDPQMKPLVAQIYGSVQDAWNPVEERVGLPLSEVLGIPQGEICIALVAVEDQKPGLVAFVDAGDRLLQVRTLLDRGEGLIRDRGGSKSTEPVGDFEVAVYRSPSGATFYLIERDSTLCVAASQEIMQFVLTAWSEGTGETLADNDRFNAIMSRCAGAVDDPPHITWFVDPIEGVRRLARGSFAATGLALLPVLGFDGIEGVGGSMTYATGEFDEVQHLHILLSSPRTGVLEAIALSSGESMPEVWVSPDCVSYTTLHWDLHQTYKVAAGLYNSLVGEGALEQEFRTRISDPLGADFETEILPALDGRATFVQWVEKPVRINSITTLVGFKLRNPDAFQAILDKIVQKHANLEKQRFGRASYWTLRGPNRPVRENAPSLRQPQLCLGIVGNYLLISDSAAAFEEAVLTASDTSRGLANSLDFKLIASKIKRQPGGDAPGLVQFLRSEERLRFWYDFATSDESQRRLTQRGENSDFFRSVDQAFKDNPLPPFSVLAQYLAPGGGMMTSDETGLHYSTFTLKRE